MVEIQIGGEVGEVEEAADRIRRLFRVTTEKGPHVNPHGPGVLIYLEVDLPAGAGEDDAPLTGP